MSNQPTDLPVGLTGSIATGKSTVAAMLARRGCHIIDADGIARQVVMPKMPAWQAVVETLGRQVLQPDEQLDREYLGKIVFSNPEKRRQLEAIVHPEVYAEIKRQFAAWRRQYPTGLVVIDIPLLFENRTRIDFREIILVYAPYEVQLKRLMERDGIDEHSARQRIAAQMAIEDKKALASCIIDNSGDLAGTRRQVEKILQALEIDDRK